MIWSTGPVGVNHRAIMRDGTVVAVAESVEQAAFIVRTMNQNDADSRTLEITRQEIRRVADQVYVLSRTDIVDQLEALL